MKILWGLVPAVLAALAGSAAAQQTGSYADSKGNVTIQAPLHSMTLGGAGYDSTNTRGGVATPVWAVPPGGNGGMSVQTLEETDGNTATNQPANWSPSFVTGADSSNMTLTFYNVKPLQALYDSKYAGNVYASAPPHISQFFVVQVMDATTSTIDKSWIVFPFHGKAYQKAGAPTITLDQNTSSSDFITLPEFFQGRAVSYGTNDSSRNNDSALLYFNPTTYAPGNGLVDGYDYPAYNGLYSASHMNRGVNYTATGYFPGHTDMVPGYSATAAYVGPMTGFGTMPRLYQTQNNKFTFQMNLGPMPALKKIIVDSYFAETRSDDPTLTIAPFSSCYGTAGTCAGQDHGGMTRSVKSRSLRQAWQTFPMDFYFTFTPTAGKATGYSVPVAGNPTAVNATTAKILVSDTPDNVFMQCPARTAVGSSVADPNTGTTKIDCSMVSVSVPAMYVGVQTSTTAKGMDSSGRFNACTIISACNSVTSGYSATSTAPSTYTRAVVGVQHCAGCNVSLNSMSETAALTSPCGGCSQVKSNIAVSGSITGGTDPNPNSVCSYSGDMGSGDSAVSTTYSTTWDAGVTGVRNLKITCTEGQGSYTAWIKETMSRTSTRWCTMQSWNKGPGTSVAEPAAAYCPAGF